MYKKELETLLNSPKFPNAFLLFGVEEYQIELFATEILAKFKDFNLLSFYYDEYDFSAAKSHLSEPSLFGGEALLHIKTDKKIPSKELKVLIDATKNGGAFIYEFHEGDTRITSEVQRPFGTNFARFFKPSTPNEALSLLQRQSNKIGLNITQNALYEIYRIHNENLYLAASELNKLSNLNEPINENIVRKLVFGLSPVAFDDFFDKFINLQDIKQDFYSCAESADFNEIMFISSFYRAIFRLFKLHISIKISGKFGTKEVLGYNPPSNVANELKRQCLGINLGQYKALFVTLNLAEFEIKTNTKLDKTQFLLAELLAMQNLIRKNSKY